MVMGKIPSTQNRKMMMRLATVLCAFALVGPALAAPSCSGAALGPVPVSGGVCFSVWAPNAGDATVNPENGACFVCPPAAPGGLFVVSVPEGWEWSQG